MKTLDFMNRQEAVYRGTKVSLKRNTFQCKRNNKLPHSYVLIDSKHYHWCKGTFKNYKCRHCGKKDFEMIKD